MKKRKPAYQWLDRGLLYGPYYTLCLNEDEFRSAMRHCGEEENDIGSFVNNTHSDATTHVFRDRKGRLCTVVCLKGWETRTGIEIAGLLVHEAVHIFQNWCESVGEDTPGSETEAYSVQWLSQCLMWEFERRMGAAPKGRRK